MELIYRIVKDIFDNIDAFFFYYFDTKYYVVFLVPIVSLACFVIYRIFKLIVRQVYY